VNVPVRSPIAQALAPVTADQLLTRIREKCEESFKFYARYMFKARKGVKFVFSDHHDLICEDLERIYRGEIQNYILNMPPRYSKTELVIVLFASWCFMKNPRCEFLHLSYADKLVKRNSEGIRSIITSAEFRQLWPEISILAHTSSKDAWATKQGGVFMAAPAGGTVTGFGAGRMDEWDEATQTFKFSGALMVDDPLKPKDYKHETIREEVNSNWDETIKSRRNSPHTPTIVVMQRIGEKDFTAYLLADTEMKWFHRCMPALIDEGLPTERALWPAKHTVDQLKAMRDKKNDRGEVNPVAKAMFNAQMQQNPRSLEGNLLQASWWRYYASKEEVLQRCTFFFFTADTAYTKNTANDPSAIHLWGAERGKRLYLLDRISGHWEFPALLENSGKFWRTCPDAQRMYVEAKASGLSLIQSLRTQGIRAVAWKPKDYGYPDDKVGRVKEASWNIFNGDIWLPDPEIAPWVDQVVDQCSAFTTDDTHAHDDDVDALTMAVSVFTKYGGGTRRVEEKESRPAQG
jgi:predicted phage terminase large subunit-like protein